MGSLTARHTENWVLDDAYFEQRAGLRRREIGMIQDRSLIDTFRYAFDRVPLYRKKFQEAGLNRNSVRGRADLEKIPFTTAVDIRPDPGQGRTTADILAVPVSEVALIHSSSGTTGRPKVFPYTGGDILKWAKNSALMLWMGGCRKEDVVIGPVPFGEFTGGGGLYFGFTCLGATYIPLSVGAGISEKVLAHLTGSMRMGDREVLLDPILHASAIFCLPSFLPRLLEVMDQRGFDSDALKLRKIFIGGEPSSEAMLERVIERLGIRPREFFGMGDFYGPGMAAECDAGGCLHVISDAYIAEVIDPASGQPVPEGAMGELVVTGLGKEAFPLLRYRTGDRTRSLAQDCQCGLGHYRIGRIPGRIDADDIMLPGAVLVNRTFLEETILRVDGTEPEYAVTVAPDPKSPTLQRLHIAVEGAPSRREEIASTINQRLQIEYGQKSILYILPVGSLPRYPGKAKRVLSPQEFQTVVAGEPVAW